MALINRKLSQKETVFLLAAPGRVHISSSIIRELAMHKKRLANYVPEAIEQEVYEYLFEYYKNLKQANTAK